MPIDLAQILKTDPISATLTQARKDSARLDMHIRGINLSSAIQCMDEFESEQKKNIRQKYARSNRDIFTRLHRPIDKVFSASGGSTVVSLPESQQKPFNAYLQTIRKGMSLRKWVQQIALSAYQIDPNGLIFIEIDKNARPYPTYKSTTDIFYYDANGRDINMVIFTLTQSEVNGYALETGEPQAVTARIEANATGTKKGNCRYYRVVDAVSDRIVEWDGSQVYEFDTLTIPNPFGRCPAIIVSDIYDFNSDLLLSPDAEIVELANATLVQGSVFEIWKNLHMFPKHWRVQSICPECQGNKLVGGVECKACTGTGFQKRSSVRDEIIVPMPESNDGRVTIPTQFDGYTTPPSEAWLLATNDIDRLFKMMFQTLWGYSPDGNAPVVKASGDKKTATQVLDEGNSKIQRLYAYSEWAENIEKFVIDITGKYLYPSTYGGCSVNYGDRYIMEGPDEIWIKYSDARKNGAAQAILDTLLKDYYESKYFGNPVQLQVALKQMRVEPWVHLSLRETQALPATNLDKACKAYFSEWASTITDMIWLLKDDITLRKLLEAYAQPKMDIITKEAADAAVEGEFSPAMQNKKATSPIT